MPKFELHKNEIAAGEIEFSNLVIDGEDQLKAFEKSISQDRKAKSSFRRLNALIMLFSDGVQLSQYQSRPIGGGKKLFEFKANDCRLYYTIIPSQGYAICLGGHKKNQKKDIAKLVRLESEILNQIDKYGQLEVVEPKKKEEEENKT